MIHWLEFKIFQYVQVVHPLCFFLQSTESKLELFLKGD